MPEPVGVTQKVALDAIWDMLSRGGRWPTFKELDQHLYRIHDLDAAHLLPELPPGLLYGVDTGSIMPIAETTTIGLTVAGDQAGVVVFGHAVAFALTAAVQAQSVEEATPRSWLEADQPGDRHPAGTLARHCHHRGLTTGCPGTGLGRAQGLPRLVLDDDPCLGRRR